MLAKPYRGEEAAILLVSANERRRLIVARILRRAGFRVDTVYSSREALHRLALGRESERHPALVLSDQESLGQGAEQIIQAVENAELGIPTVVLSGIGTDEDIIACLRAGAIDYITLPAEPEEILQVVRHALGYPTVP